MDKRSPFGIIAFVSVFLFSCASGSDTPEEIVPPVPDPPVVSRPDPELRSLSFPVSLNAGLLKEDVTAEIVGDSLIWLYAFMYDNGFVPSVEYTGDSVTINGKLIARDGAVKMETPGVGFWDPLRLCVHSGSKKKDYKVYVRNYTGIPAIWITTEGNAWVASTEEYINGHIKIVEDPFDVNSVSRPFEYDMRIRGRGNMTWVNTNKKSYKLKFDEKVSPFGEPQDKKWVLLANAFDVSAIRNDIAFCLSRMSNLDYTPSSHFGWLMYNGSCQGLYQLTEHVKASKNRVDVGDDGFLLEVDAKYSSDDVIFSVAHQWHPLNIKAPDVVAGDDNYNYIVDYISQVDSVLYSPGFSDETEGYRKWIDVSSFVDWYLINEISKNNDAIMFSSCYMSLRRGEKLKMGPVWDFDLAFGSTADHAVIDNGNDKPTGFWVKNAPWITRMFEDPYFVNAVKERFAYFYQHKEDIMSEIDQRAAYLRYAVQNNNLVWQNIGAETLPSETIWNAYLQEIGQMKSWLDTRLEWMRSEFAFPQ